ncbi:MAG TPA: helix-turn-helix domain-containing protein [Solirubrobacterales bacterium]|nr:helix-turn-helix domain-containing protein [Solirubrobacterales bacterium]
MPTKFGRAEISEADKTLAKALSHPVRAAALTILNARVASPTEIAAELELPLGNVSYHVNELEKYGCIELVRTAPNRGAVEHFYRGIAPQYLSDDFFAKLSYAVRNSLSWAGVRVIVGAIRDSLQADLFDKRTDRHVTAVTYELDGQGWKEAKELYDKTLKELIEIGARAQGRIVERKRLGGHGLRATFIQLAFESPDGSPKEHELGKIVEG